MKVFLSYSRHDDEPFVRRLAGHLTGAGLGVWFDRVDMPSRSLTFLDEIRRAIDDADRLLVVLGPQALESEYVRSEWQYALTCGKPVTPTLRLGEYETLPAELGAVHCPDARASRPGGDAFAEIVRVLSEPVVPLGTLVGLPALPPHFRPRPDEMSAVVAGLIGDLTSTTPALDWDRVTVIAGMGGAGKSVLASAAARSTPVRRACTDGVFWVDAREHSRPVELADRVRQLVAPGVGELSRALAGRRCLVVLDNAEEADQVAVLAAGLDATGRLLVTSRDAHLVDEARIVPLGGLSVVAARHLLADWIGADAPAGPCDELIRRCEGLPFAVALCGAMAAHGVPLQMIAERVEAADLTFLERRFPGYPYPSLLPMLDASLDVLRDRSTQAAELFPTFAVFRNGTRVPAPVVERFWAGRGVPAAHTAKHLALLRGLSLVRGDRDEVQLHQLVHDYATALAGDVTLLHRELLEAYAFRAGTDPGGGPDDGYYHANLVLHLLGAGRTEDAVVILTTSPSWMLAKQKAPHRRGTFTADADRVLAVLATGPVDLAALVRLHTARHVARFGSSAWQPAVLQAMVAVGDDADALAAVRATADPGQRLGQVLELASEVGRAWRPTTEFLTEARAARDAEPDPVRRGRLDLEITRHLVQRAELPEALATWQALPGTSDLDDLALLLITRLWRAGEHAQAHRIAEDNPAARRLVDVLAVAGSDDEVRRRFGRIPAGRDGRLARHFAATLLNEAGHHAVAIELATALDQQEQALVLSAVPDPGAVADALQAARRLPHGLNRALGLMAAADALGRLPAPVPDEPPPAAPVEAPAPHRWFAWRRRAAAPVAPPRPDRAELAARSARALAAARLAGINPDTLARESLQEIELGPPEERQFTLGALAQRALSRADPGAAEMVRAWRAAVDEVPDGWQRSESLGRIASALAGTGDLPAARAVLAAAVTAAATADSGADFDKAMTTVLPAYAADGHLTAVLGRATAITDPEIRLAVLGALARSCAERGRADETTVLVARAGDEADRKVLTADHARALARGGRVDEALDAIRDSDDESLLASVVTAFTEADRIEAATGVAERIPDGYHRVVACCALARASGDRTWLTRAERSLPPPPWLGYALARTELAGATATLDPAAAGEAFRVAVGAALGVEEPQISLGGLVGARHRWTALDTVAAAMAGHGLPGEIEALAGAVSDDGSDWMALRARVLGHAAVARRRAGEPAGELFDQARRCAAAIGGAFLGTDWRFVAWASIAHRLCEAELWPEGLAAAERVHPGLDPYLAVLAECCGPKVAGFRVTHLTAAVEIVAWVRPDWRNLADTFSHP